MNVGGDKENMVLQLLTFFVLACLTVYSVWYVVLYNARSYAELY